MRRQRKPINFFRIAVLLLMIGIVVYINQMVIPSIPTPFVDTPTATREPGSYLTEAEALFNDGKFFQAVAVYQEVVRIQPDNPAIHLAMARAQIFAGQYDESLTTTANALLLSPNNSMAHALRAWALTRMGDFLPARESILRALELDPNNGVAHAYYAFLLGNEYIATGSFDSITLAVEESRVAYDLSRNSLEARWSRAFILELTDNREEAIQEYLAAIQINPNIPELHIDLGRTYSVLGVYDKAIEEYTLANTFNPADPRPDLYSSRVERSRGSFALAAQYAEQAVKDVPTDPYLRGNWGVMLYKYNDWPAAIEQLSLAINGGMIDETLVVEPIRLSGGDVRIAEFFYTYALILARVDRCGEALPIAQLILSGVPTDEIAVYNAREINRLCEENLRNPTPNPTATLGPTPTP
ncbi:MAG: tetratricopeptide repeat protein [Chloroflexota bacterium]